MNPKTVYVNPTYKVYIFGDKVYDDGIINYTNIKNEYIWAELDYIKQIRYIGILRDGKILIGSGFNQTVLDIILNF